MKYLKISPDDNVAVALTDIQGGSDIEVGVRTVRLQQDIPRAHKFALEAIATGQPIIKYGHPIAQAIEAIPAGAWVHSHNVRTRLSGVLNYDYIPLSANTSSLKLSPSPEVPCFMGYERPDGQVGVRNELWIIPTVGCVNAIAQTLARRFTETPLSGSLEGVHAFQHPYGCSQLGDDHEKTRQILAGLARHPNAGGVLVIGLGCENNTLSGFRELLGNAGYDRYRFMVVQDLEDEETVGLRLLSELAEQTGGIRRKPLPLSRLRIGLKCGGSDAFSGITANPLLGAFSDWLTAHGGTTVLTETPEMFGAETILMNRCASRTVFEKCVAMVNGFKEYFMRHNQVVYENPSPGNKEGGITTLEEKSLGCVQKGGTSPVVDVLPYGGQLQCAGLNLLDGPGNDIVSVTAMAAAGAHMVLFTTGRGTPLGGPIPTVKISSNTPLAMRKKNWIDFDAGQLLEGGNLPDLCTGFTQAVLQYAGGIQRTRAEINGFREIAIFKDGVTL